MDEAWCDNCEKKVYVYHEPQPCSFNCCQYCGKWLGEIFIEPPSRFKLKKWKALFSDGIVSSPYYDDDHIIRELNEEDEELQCYYLSNCNDDFHKEDEENEEMSRKTMPEIEIPDCKHADLEEGLVGVKANLERKDKELHLLREYLNVTIKDLQADIHGWRAKYLHAKSILHLNGIPFVDP